MILIINKDSILNSHETYELTKSFFNDEKIIIGENENNISPRLSLKIIENRSSYKGILVDGFNNSISKEIEFSSLKIYRDESSSKKIIAKQIIYKLLEENSGRSLPWGLLTGIRPNKIVHKLIDLNVSYDEVLIILTKSYFLNIEKAKLLLRIAKNQRETISNISKNSYSIYINIPFCPSRCSYCSFPSLLASRNLSEMEGYIEVILEELELTRQKMTNWNVNSVYIGGGTPTSLNYDLMEKLIFYIRNKFQVLMSFVSKLADQTL